MPIKQEYRVDRKHLSAFYDVNTSFVPLVFLIFHSLLWFLLEHYTIGYYLHSLLLPRWVFRIAYLLPCAYIVFRQVRMLMLARRTLQYVFFENKATGYSPSGKITSFFYLTIKRIYENDVFLKIASSRYAAILKKDELAQEELEAATNAIAAGCPTVRRIAKKGKSLRYTLLSTVVIVIVLLNCFGLPPSVWYGFSLSETAESAAYYRYASTYGIESEDDLFIIKYDVGGEAVICIFDVNGDSPTERYRASREIDLWDYSLSSLTRSLWTIRGATSSQIPVAFETESASVCVIMADSNRTVLVTHDITTTCRIETERMGRKTTMRKNDGKVALTKWSYITDDIPQDLILYIGDEAYPIGEMLAGK